jgi:hypothetical protein
MHDWEASRLYLSEVLEEFPMSNWASKAQYDIAESYAREKKWEDAIDQYTIFVQSYFDEELQEKAKKRLEEIRLYYAAEARKMQRDDSPDLINGTTGTPALIKTPSNEAGSSTP